MSRINTFEIIPVIDLLGGSVVRGVKGERHNYKPVKPIFCSSSDPLEIATSYRDYFNFSSIYIADLDRITGSGNNLEVVKNIKKLFPDPGQVYCDPGISDSCDVDYIHSYIDNLVIGTETLPSLQLINDVTNTFGMEKVTLSLDIKSGNVLTRAKELTDLGLSSVVDKLVNTGIKRMFVIVLDAVGSFRGVDTVSFSSLQKGDLAVFLGGGVRDAKDISRLREIGYSGCLVASCLYNGNITPDHIRNYSKR